MVIKMTNRLLSIVIALALSSGIVAHASQAPQRPLAPLTLPAALQTAASHVGETATSAIDPAAAIRSAYQRDHVALEHLRQLATPLKGSARPAFEQFVSDQEAALTSVERSALATTRPSAASAIAAMDKLVSAAQAELTRQLSAATAVTAKSKGSGQNGQSQNGSQNGQSSKGQKQGNSQSGNSQGGND